MKKKLKGLIDLESINPHCFVSFDGNSVKLELLMNSIISGIAAQINTNQVLTLTLQARNRLPFLLTINFITFKHCSNLCIFYSFVFALFSYLFIFYSLKIRLILSKRNKTPNTTLQYSFRAKINADLV